MGYINWANSIVRKFNIVDVFLIELSSVTFGLLLAVLVPSLTNINVLWIAAVVVLLAMRPLYTAVFGK